MCDARHDEWVLLAFKPSIVISREETEHHQGKDFDMVMSQLTDENGCPICREGEFKDPCQTECFHVYCSDYLAEWGRKY